MGEGDTSPTGGLFVRVGGGSRGYLLLISYKSGSVALLREQAVSETTVFELN